MSASAAIPPRFDHVMYSGTLPDARSRIAAVLLSGKAICSEADCDRLPLGGTRVLMLGAPRSMQELARLACVVEPARLTLWFFSSAEQQLCKDAWSESDVACVPTHDPVFDRFIRDEFRQFPHAMAELFPASADSIVVAARYVCLRMRLVMGDTPDTHDAAVGVAVRYDLPLNVTYVVFASDTGADLTFTTEEPWHCWRASSSRMHTTLDGLVAVADIIDRLERILERAHAL